MLPLLVLFVMMLFPRTLLLLFSEKLHDLMPVNRTCSTDCDRYARHCLDHIGHCGWIDVRKRRIP